MLLFRELRQLGKLEISADTSAIPAIDELDPERCYIAWNMVLITAAAADELRDVFIFVEDSCVALAIEPALVSSTALGAASPAALDTISSAPIERRSGQGRRASDQAAQTSSIRVAAAKLDQLVDLVGQLVTVQARLLEIAARREDRDMQAVAEEIESLTAELRETSMGMRTLPLRSTFERFKRLVYDLGRTLRKEVELTFEGADTELDKTVIDQLSDPTVIKNLGRLYRSVQIMSGATILGDGTVALILDLHRLAQNVIRTSSVNPRTHARAPCPQGVA